MPKELIYTDTRPFVITSDGGEHAAGQGIPLPEGSSESVYQRAVHVGWSRRKYVEVGVARLNIATEWVEEGTFTSLDRDGVNRLIRTLQKARDAAFGKDA